VVVNLVIEHLNDAEMRERRLFHEIERMADNPPPLAGQRGQRSPLRWAGHSVPMWLAVATWSAAVTKVQPRPQVAGGAPGRI
jgi:hypothetical protein